MRLTAMQQCRAVMRMSLLLLLCAEKMLDTENTVGFIALV